MSTEECRRIGGVVAQHINDNEWHCPPIADVLELAGLWPMRECICRRGHGQLSGLPIVPGMSRMLKWWEEDNSPFVDEDEESRSRNQLLSRFN